MSARDQLHKEATRALENDGWTITHDPFVLPFGTTFTEIDLGAEMLIAAEKGEIRIAVEVKSFLGQSAIAEFHTALGQYLNYRAALREHQPDRRLFLAVPDQIYGTFFDQEIVRRIIEQYELRIVVFNPVTKQVVQWKN